MMWNWTCNARKKGSGLVLTLALGVALAGCGSGSGSGEAAQNTATPASAENKPTQAAADKTLTVYTAGPEGLANKLIEDFQSQSGIKVEMFQGTTGKILARLEAEKSNPVADVVILASLPSAQGLKNEGLTLPYPEAQNADKLNKDWSDPEGNYFSTSASALGIAYNTKLVTTPPTSWSDLTKPEYKDQINIPDPSLSGSALDFITGYLSDQGDGGWSLFEQYKANGVALAGATRRHLIRSSPGRRAW
ncbi:hypothetical protein GCM10010913_38270 [Paenibacillus aceti]|uniref:ABC transporter substrate-binding protein n=1 Tax=Paenibacillus aceti TaxID=1820010 RepID=A0ABQ1W441_9BACL|nr:hypothetical protein GCM10010913_38270 [Paenibacillus aceti]